MKKHEWDKVQTDSASLPSFAKKYLGEKNVLKLVGNLKGKKVLELGSGNGYWLDLFSKKGAECVGVELADKQLELAKNKNSKGLISYIKGDIVNLEKLGLGSAVYDIVLLEHVLLEISSLKKMKKILQGAYKALKPNGIIVISDIHPFALSFGREGIKISKNYHYFSSGDIFEIISHRVDGQKTIYRDFHWTLSDLVGVTTAAGFKITNLLEPRPTAVLAKKYPELEYRLKIPTSIMIKAVK